MVNARVQRFVRSTAAFAGALGSVTATTGTCLVGNTSGWCTGGTFAASSADGGFDQTVAVAADPANNAFYASDNTNYKLNKFNLTTGAFIGAIGYSNFSTGTCPAGGISTTWCTGGAFLIPTIYDLSINVSNVQVSTSTGYLYFSGLEGSRIVRLPLTF